jgi:hypothetical protein
MLGSREDVARKYVLSKVPPKNVEVLNILVEAEGLKPFNLSIEVDLDLTAQTKNVDTANLADEAAKQALRAAENYLRTLK